MSHLCKLEHPYESDGPCVLTADSDDHKSKKRHKKEKKEKKSDKKVHLILTPNPFLSLYRLNILGSGRW